MIAAGSGPHTAYMLSASLLPGTLDSACSIRSQPVGLCADGQSNTVETHAIGRASLCVVVCAYIDTITIRSTSSD